MNDVTDERPDAELLEDFTRNRSEAAFAAIVGRYVGLVHSVALRHTAVPEQTQDITQAVFIILARKAGSLGRKTVLSGWLYHTARLTAANYQRAESRRIRREQEAYMQSIMEAGATPVWDEVSPQLDEAMAKLGTADRDALVLRYFENQSLTQVGAALGIEERAAQKRVGRALEKLRKFFARRGVTLSAAVIAGVLSANAVQAAPAGLAVTTAAAATGGLTISATITTLINETMKTMTWLKIKFAAGVGVAALLAAGTATVAISRPAAGDGAMKPAEILAKTHAAYAALSSYRDHGTVVSQIGGQELRMDFHTRLQRPGSYRIDWQHETGPMGMATGSDGVIWSDAAGDHLRTDGSALTAQKAETKRLKSRKQAAGAAMAHSLGAAETVPGAFFGEDLGDMFVTPALAGRYPLHAEADAVAGGVDCLVLTTDAMDLSQVPGVGKPGTATITLWIGKQDFLLHQSRTKYTEKVDEQVLNSDAALDAAIKKSLAMQGKPATPDAIAAMRPMMRTVMKQVQSTLKDSFTAGIVTVQTHAGIVVNQPFTAADFAVEAGQ